MSGGIGSQAPSMGFERMQVRLLGLPVRVHVESMAHLDALQREIDVINFDDQSAAPRRLRALIDELQERFGGLSEHPDAELRAAIDQEDEAIDLVYEVPVEVAEAFQRLSEVLDAVDEYCRQGEHLLTLASPPQAVAYRRWFFGEFSAQLHGAAPMPWTQIDERELAAAPIQSDAEAAESSVTAEGGDAGDAYVVPPDWTVEERADEVVVRPAGELDLQTAPELRDLIQAVRREGVERVHLDLSEVSFVDSVGLSMIVSAHQRLAADGVPMTVLVPAALQRLFDISGLGELLDLQS
jgi:anti-anti-sigma factor